MLKKVSKKFLSIILCIATILCMVPIGVFTVCAESLSENDAKIGDTEYATLKEAVTAANEIEGGATITLLSDITLSEKLTISKNITISGKHTITRGIAGTIFAVGANATLTLDGGLVIDGGNEWTFDSENFYADLAAAKTNSTGAKESYATSEEGGLVATAAMITISGTSGAVVMNKATIQNCWAENHNDDSIFSVPAGATLTINDGALISHIRGSVVGYLSGLWTMTGGKITGVHGHNTNGCLVSIRNSGLFTVNGGEICYNTLLGRNNNGSGILAEVYGTSPKLIVNGGNIHDNANFCPGGGWGSIVYLNGGGDFEMNGGTIGNGNSDKCTTIGVNNPKSTVKLNAGTINIEKTTAGMYDSLLFGNVTIGEDMTISGGDVRFCGTSDNSLVINGTVNSNMLLRAENITNNGVVNGDVTITKDSWAGNSGKVNISSGKWGGNFTLGPDTELTLSGGETVKDASNNITVTTGTNLTISDGTWNGTITVEDGANIEIEGGIWNGKIIIKSGAEASFDVSGENASNVADILDNVIFEGEIDPEKIKLPQGVTYHSVTFKCEGKETLTVYVKDNQTVTIPDSISDLEGVVWYNGEEKFDFKSNIKGDITLEAKKIFSITFDSDGGSKVETITQGYGSAISAPKAPTKEGYTFAGWDKEIPETMPAGDLEIKALWTINKHTVTFETDGGSKIDTITQEYGSVITAPEAPTKAGYVFDNWYVDGEVFDLEGHRLVGDITVEARYKVDKNNNGIEDTVDPAYTDSADDVFGRLRNILGMFIRIILSIIFMPFLIGSFI